VSTILVVANETIRGAKLLERIKAKADEHGEGTRVVVCVPRKNPGHGNLVYEDFVFDAAKARIDLARRFLRDIGIQAIGEVGDPDPYTATMDAVLEHRPDEIIISTKPSTSSGWLRRDLVERIADATDLPVEHVVVDPISESVPLHVTAVLTAKTASSDALLEHCRAKAASVEGTQLFIVVVPPEGGQGVEVARARARMAQVVDRLLADGHVVAGIIGDPDPYTAIMSAAEYFNFDDVVIATLPSTRSGWLRADLIDRVRKASGLPVEHVEVAERAVA
jgi:hypothetical protein